MRKLLTITALVLFIALASPMWAQLNDVYQLHPFDSDGDFNIKIVNPGEQGTPISTDHGAVCADIYVFDDNQEMTQCCSCKLTANAVLRLRANELITHPLTGVTPFFGVIKIVSDSVANCNERGPVPTPDLRVWFQTDIPARAYDQFAQATLQADELQFLGQACSFVQYLGSGKGKCNCGLTPP